MSADKLASFRVDSQLWEQFQSYAKENNTNASALLVAYIKSVVNTGNIITSNPVVNTSSEIIDPSLSIQDIDNRIDDKIKQSIQINTPSIQQIEDLIDARIASACQLGAVRDAIATSYKAVMGQFNGLLEQLDLKSQLQELQSNPPAPATNDQLLTTDDQLPMTNDQQETGNREQGIGEHEDADQVDSDLKPDTQLPGDNLTELKSVNSPAPLPTKNQTDYVQKKLKKIRIEKTTVQIKEAFKSAGFDGTNYELLRGEIIESLSNE